MSVSTCTLSGWGGELLHVLETSYNSLYGAAKEAGFWPCLQDPKKKKDPKEA